MLRVLSFNVFGPRLQISIEYVIATILQTRADIVGLQEADNLVAKIAQELSKATNIHWYHDTRAAVLSRWPIEHAVGAWVYILCPLSISLSVSPSTSPTLDYKRILVTSLHLPSRLYGPERLFSGIPPTKVEQDERLVRLPALKVRLEALSHLNTHTNIGRDGYRDDTIVLMGDFNVPSHLDDERVRWPVSTLLEDLHYVDTYRYIHPSVSKDPGITWWAVRDTDGCPRDMPCTRREPSGRIDFIYVKGAYVVDSLVVGESSDIIVRPWRSDHRAVLSVLLI